jgi:hypothetical protein
VGIGVQQDLIARLSLGVGGGKIREGRFRSRPLEALGIHVQPPAVRGDGRERLG